MIVVSNTSPPIALAKIGVFHLLHSLYKDLCIPQAVREEIVVIGDRPGVEEVTSATWIRTVSVSNLVAVQLLRERLDAGESEAIVLALELKADLLLIDEARGRRIAQSQGLNVIGTVGTLVAAKRQGLILEVTPLLDSLVASEFRLGQKLYQTARSLVGEDN